MPDWKNLVQKRLAALNLTAPAESDLAEELAQHLEDRYRDLTAGGIAPDDAYRQVAGELDNLRPLRAAVPAAHHLPRYDPV
ncbi:MAG TPA: permease prefix domain 1-containing protein, partial [Candidatus Acidoferrum sp.]|nr:permease prefix domain 1-containing protein [Candidatus Acidoferrum sp.]